MAERLATAKLCCVAWHRASSSSSMKVVHETLPLLYNIFLLKLEVFKSVFTVIIFYRLRKIKVIFYRFLDNNSRNILVMGQYGIVIYYTI